MPRKSANKLMAEAIGNSAAGGRTYESYYQPAVTDQATGAYLGLNDSLFIRQWIFTRPILQLYCLLDLRLAQANNARMVVGPAGMCHRGVSPGCVTGMYHRDRCHRHGMCHRELFGSIRLRASWSLFNYEVTVTYLKPVPPHARRWLRNCQCRSL